ncbi:MAG: hypothetical protein HOH13_04400 [Crocinitomicaceae bacterium]|jgi:hypothetical protein|nr:hypothetical protein [Crocinitomicaceae bacterium]MBT5403671.1 hypothetical protein [Crocinitomicaceae bacterium]MBT6029521.1 hypothetical protein [Crocinitomicaceae bacterium]MBT6513816.1 hypothetical protein [Crocinitomicaceae bacterium]
MKKLNILSLILIVLFASCTKEEDLDGNNIAFESTQFTLQERISLTIPNTVLSGISFITACWDIPFGAEISYEQLVPSSNPNPYAYLVKDIKPKVIKMELLNVEGCDFSMLDNVDIYIVDKEVVNMTDIVVFDPLNPTASYNAKFLASIDNIPDGVGSILYPNVMPDVTIDEFIHDDDFQIYMNMKIDKTFTSEVALIKATLDLDVTLINNE